MSIFVSTDIHSSVFIHFLYHITNELKKKIPVSIFNNCKMGNGPHSS